MQILFKNLPNEKAFNLKYLKAFCNHVNKTTTILEFYPVKIIESQTGLRNALIRSRYKENKKNTICKILLFENTQGDLKISIRKGFMLGFLGDLKNLQNNVDQLKGKK